MGRPKGIAMSRTVQLTIPKDWLGDLGDEEMTLREVVRLGVRQVKMARAIRLYLDGVGSLGYIGEKLGLDKRELIREARLRNVEPDASDLTEDEEVQA